MKQNIWSQKYDINSLLVNSQKQLGLFGLLGLFQDTAWMHAEHLGHGYESMLKEDTAWVLTRQKVRMKEWPHWGEDIELKTWIRPIQSLVAVRDFEVLRNSGVIGECTTQWLILNLKTRKPAEKALVIPSSEVREEGYLNLEASKIVPQRNLKEFAEFHVRNSDLDMNGHVNNTRYAQWILDSVPLGKHTEYVIEEYEVNFLAETKAGDQIIILGGELSQEKIQFQAVRKTDLKTVFIASLKVGPRHLVPSRNLF